MIKGHAGDRPCAMQVLASAVSVEAMMTEYRVTMNGRVLDRHPGARHAGIGGGVCREHADQDALADQSYVGRVEADIVLVLSKVAVTNNLVDASLI